jgi:hypothetical protein
MKTIIRISLFLLLFAHSGCIKEIVQTKNYPSEELISAKNGAGNPQTFQLGQVYGGGYIFYIDETGQHGLIISKNDVDGGPFKWRKENDTSAVGAFNNDGFYNTKRIIQVYGNVPKYVNPYAALAAKNYNGGGFNDWYLPSYVDWGKINATRNMSIDLNISSDVNYITSSEDPWNFVGYQVLFFTSAGYGGNGGILGTGKDVAYPIRVIRKF